MTEKKIGSKLLFLFSMCFASFLLSLLLFPVSSKAANYSKEYLNLDVNWNSQKLSLYCNFKVAMCRAYDLGNGRYHLYTKYNDEYYKVEYYYGSVSFNNYSIVFQPNEAIWQIVSGSNFTNGAYAFLPNNQVPIFDTVSEMESYLSAPDIDFDNPLYSPNIPVPNVTVNYRELTSIPTIDVPLNVSIPSFSDYYIQSFALFDQPTEIFVQKTYPGGYVYNTVNTFSAYSDLVTFQDLNVPGDFSLDSFHLLMNDAWYHSMIQDNAINFGFVSGLTTQMQDSAKNKYFTLRKNMCLAGNEIYLYFRYFTIIDNQVLVGPWRIWNSYNPNEYTDEVPAYYQPYNPAVGSSSTNNEVTPVSSSSPVPPEIYNPVSTGQNINIEVKQNVPNYPDYPTIASYNKDNLLVDTMNQLNSLNGFIGDFSDFLVATFVFIPSWIWTIIGVGFSLSIIVMFLKIL